MTGVIAEAVSGNISVRTRVIDKVVREASANALGVERSDVTTEVSELGQGIAVSVAARISIPDLRDHQVVQTTRPLIAQMRETQRTLECEIARLTGREVRRVSISITGARVAVTRRVR